MKLTVVATALVLSSAPAFAGDAEGTMKPWGTVDVTLQKFAFRGSVVGAILVLKNNTDKPENISSMMQFQMLSDEGDKGDFAFGSSSCDGTIPPNGVLKCKLNYTFPTPPKSASLQVGAGFDGDPVFFTLDKK